ncbi:MULTISPECIES: hypothetical protein [unclassified Pseudoalteromonas]|uniref:hypothetical protein n=1 Tax=unclassified Pseudoalteromonas TaxID=194690 RepID=UPI00209780E3|nr:hypothetical protein [Pseudoalteromonas sp. XMcav2-N]MCO7190221.1 hypothetical protein [Pseudoalteromonas sp. XMcav2-N]
MEQFPTPEAELVMQASLDKQVKRGQITLQVGDNESLLGTTSDTAHLLLVEFSKLVSSIASANSLDDIKASAQDCTDLIGTISEQVDSGVLYFPYQQKGTEVVLSDIQSRAKGVSEILAP